VKEIYLRYVFFPSSSPLGFMQTLRTNRYIQLE
jgi:hypothetical protein